jgi:nucleoid DNA-binding protein
LASILTGMSTVTKKDLVMEVSSQTKLNQREASEALEVIVSTIADRLVAGDDLALRGFGSFRLRVVRSRSGRNLSRPSESIEIPAHCVVRFKPSPRLRQRIRDLDPLLVKSLTYADAPIDGEEDVNYRKARAMAIRRKNPDSGAHSETP